MFELALSTSDNFTRDTRKISHKQSCLSGLARVSLRLGDIGRGMRLLNDFDDSIFLQDCASILESLKQYQEAAGLMEKVAKWDRAAQLWIKGISYLLVILKNIAKQWNRLSKIIDRVSNIQILSQYAKAKEGNLLEYCATINIYSRWAIQ